MFSLPTVINKEIFSYLDNINVINSILVSKEFYRYLKKNSEMEFVIFDVDTACTLVDLYKKTKIHLEISGNIIDQQKLAKISKNIISFKYYGILSNINMENIEHLDINATEISKITNVSKKIKHIKIIYYHSNTFNLDYIILKKFNNIESLELDFGALIFNFDISLKLSSTDFPKLKKLKCYNFPLKNEDINNLTNLEDLSLMHNNYITDDAFKKLNKIKKIFLYNTKVSPRVIQYFPVIECWFPDSSPFTKNLMTDDYFHELKKYLEKLKVMGLSDCKFLHDEDIADIKLEHLIISHNNNITINGLNKHLVNLDLSMNNIIKDNDLKSLNLKYLNLSINNMITDNGLKYCKNLESLKLYSNTKITNKGLSYLKNLQYLDLNMQRLENSNSNITNDGLKNLKTLLCLELYENKNITDEGLQLLENLEVINISSNKKITVNALLKLKKLKILRCEYSLLSKNDLCKLVRTNPNLKIFLQDRHTMVLPAVYYTRNINIIKRFCYYYFGDCYW